MKLLSGASLKHLNSFAVEARARQIVELESRQDLLSLCSKYRFNPDTDLILGAGSNVLLAADIEGNVILNRIRGRRVLAESADEVLIEANGGENWHQLVLWTLAQGLSGLENLSLIPGLAGAAPMQNIGAYGVEIADLLDSVEVLELKTGEFHQLARDKCGFAYRDSRFKSTDAGRYLISRIRLRLHRKFSAKLDYSGIREQLTCMGISQPTAIQVSDAVIRLRQKKLPDPGQVPNAGSFFKNPLVSQTKATQLSKQFTGLPVYPATGGMAKLSAAWLIELCGWKGHRHGDAGISAQHALVLVNHGNASGKQLLELAEIVAGSVKDRFAVELIPEARIIQ